MTTETAVLVAAHKKFDGPLFGNSYHLIQVGSATSKVRFPYLHDDEGQNISEKNATYCELTALYWCWKHVKTPNKGLCHYRRYLAHHSFAINQENNVFSNIELDSLLQQYDLLVAKPCYRTLQLSWYPTHRELDHDRPYIYSKLAVTAVCPEYLSALEKFYTGKKICALNILIARATVFDAYCEWLFPVVWKIEQLLNENGGVPPREIGFIAERLLNVWILKNHLNLKIGMFPVTQIDKSRVTNMLKIPLERVGLLSLLKAVKSNLTYCRLSLMAALGIDVRNPKEWEE